MKKKETIFLFLLHILSLSLGTFLSLGSIDSALIFVPVYFLAYYFLIQTGLTENFYVSSEKNRFSLPTSEVLFKGHLLPGQDAEDQQEERFLSHFELSKVAKRRLLPIIYLGITSYLVFWQTQTAVGLPTVLPIICGFFVIRSVYVGHLLVPMALNLCSVVAAFSPSLSVAYYGLYCLLIFWSLQLMAEASGKQLKARNPYFLLPMTMMFMGIVYGVTFFLPEKLTEKETPAASAEFNPARESLRVSKALNSKVAETLKSLPPTVKDELADRVFKNLEDIKSAERILASAQLLDQNPEAAKKLMTQIIDQSQEIQDEFAELRKVSLGSASSPDSSVLKKLASHTGNDLPQLLSQIEGNLSKNQAELGTARSELGNSALAQEERDVVIERIDQLSNKQDKLKKAYVDLKSIDQDERSAVEAYIEAKKADIEKLRNFSKDPQALQAQVENLEQLKKLASLLKPSPAELQAIGKSLETSRQIDKMKEAERSAPILKETAQISPPKDEILKPFKKKEFKLRKFFPLVVLIGIFLVFQYLLKKTGVKKIAALDPESIKELKLEWRRLGGLSLAPREEVIHYYNLLHDAVQKVHYLSHETPPSCIVYEDLRDVNPKLERSVFVVTELFTRCFYGDKTVTDKALRNFRKGMRNILRVYGIV